MRFKVGDMICYGQEYGYVTKIKPDTNMIYINWFKFDEDYGYSTNNPINSPYNNFKKIV